MSAKETREMTDGTGEKSTDIANSHALEVCFVIVVGIIVIAAFVEALSYKLVSSRTPFVIMVPLLLLIGLQLFRLLRVGNLSAVFGRVGAAVSGQIPDFRKVLRMLRWLAALMATIVIAGHYVGLAGIIFVMIRLLAREKMRLALIVTVATTAIIFVVFELGFDIELYRGLIYRYYAGYRVF